MNQRPDWEYLLGKFTANTCTKEELLLLLEYVQEHPENDELREALQAHWERAAATPDTGMIDWEEKFAAIMQEAATDSPVYRISPRKRILKWIKPAAAALILFAIATIAYLFTYTSASPERHIASTTENLAAVKGNGDPGRTRATLTLADGALLDLDSTKNGSLTIQENVKLIKGENGIVYDAEIQPKQAVGFNLVTTPAGGKYKIVLSDGTKVWLNASSSLKFPPVFGDSVRSVDVTGEIYFEVAKAYKPGTNQRVPFEVNILSQTGQNKALKVEVLGTQFNVNAYDNEEAIATTLVEGSVKMISTAAADGSEKTVQLSPGQQANTSLAGNLSVTRNISIDEIIAWKDDLFQFEQAPVSKIIRQIARWYDVEPVFNGQIPNKQFSGKISRDVHLDELIEILKYTGINMRLENQKLIISQDQ